MRSRFDLAERSELLARLRNLSPQVATPLGRITAPEMVAQLNDQMGHTLGDGACQPRPGPLRRPLVRPAATYWLPWPRGWLKGPPQASTTRPTTWESDLETLETLVERCAARQGDDAWPEHALFGRMSERTAACFCHRHFDHHLHQFGG